MEVQPVRPRGRQKGLDQCLDLKRGVDETDEIAPPILHIIVRQASPVHRQHDEEAVPIADAGVQHDIPGGAEPIVVAGELERWSPLRRSEIDAIEVVGAARRVRIEDRKILVALGRERQPFVFGHGLELVVGDAVARRRALVCNALVTLDARDPIDPQDGGLIAHELIGEGLELLAADRVEGLEQRPQRHQFVEILIQPILQRLGLVRGNRLELEPCEFAIPMPEGKPRGNRQREAEGSRRNERQAAENASPRRDATGWVRTRPEGGAGGIERGDR
jgi:hypothetical protein